MVRTAALALALMGSAISVPARADDLIETGNGFLSRCSSERRAADFSTGLCLGYIYAFRESGVLLQQKTYCPPDGVTNGQVWDIFLSYLRSNPRERHLPTVILLSSAMAEAYPCAE